MSGGAVGEGVELLTLSAGCMELGVSRERGHRLIMTRRIAGQFIDGKWFVTRDSVEALIASGDLGGRRRLRSASPVGQ